MEDKKTIKVLYFAMLREKSGCNEDILETTAKTVEEFYEELKIKHDFDFPQNILKPAINDEFQDWKSLLNDGDTLAFIPPVSGGAPCFQ